MVINCKKFNGTSFNSNGKISNSKKSDERIMMVISQMTEFLLEKIQRQKQLAQKNYGKPTCGKNFQTGMSDIEKSTRKTDF